MNEMTKEKKQSLSWLIVALLCGAVLYFFPGFPGMSVEGQKSLAIFVFALILWIGKPIPIYLTSIGVVLLLPMVGAVESQKVAFGTLGYDIIWLMVAAMVLSSAISETNLGKRIALSLVTRFGSTPRRTLAVLIAVNFILAFFVPSTTARASLLVPIVLVLLEVYKAIPGESQFGRLACLQGVQTNAFATSMVMTATSAQVIAIGFIKEFTGQEIGYMTWLLSSLPQAILAAVLMFFIGLRVYSFKEELTTDQSNQEVQSILTGQLRDLGPLSSAEKRAAGTFLLTLFLWATGDYQEQFLGFEISTEQTAVLAMFLCLMPKIGVLTWKQAKIKWDLMVFSAGAYAAGNALNDSGGATWLIEHLVAALKLNQLSPSLVAILLIFVTVFSHLIFTSKTVRTTILIPAIISLAQNLGMDPVQLALACSFGIAATICLPPHSKVNTLYFSTGYFSVLDELKFGLIGCTVVSLCICLVYFFWLPIIL